MSRSRKGAKGPGYEYWSRRPGIKFASPGKANKRLTHRLERLKAKKDLKKSEDGER